MIKGKYILSAFLLLVVLTSSIYFVLNDSIRIDIQETRSIFKVLEDGKWVVSGVEYTNIFDGTTKMRAKNRSFETEIGESNITTVTRIANYKEGISTIEVYTFDPSSSDVELFPISHSIQVINADRPSRPYVLQYEVQKLLYTGQTKWNILSPQSFGRKMKVEWESGNYYSRIYKYKDKDEGKLTIKYKIDSDDYLKNVRLFDPVDGTWGIGSIVEEIADTFSVGGTVSDRFGVNITATNDFKLIAINVTPGSQVTKAYLYNSAKTLLSTVDVNNNRALFNYNLVTGTTYYIMTDNNGGNYLRNNSVLTGTTFSLFDLNGKIYQILPLTFGGANSNPIQYIETDDELSFVTLNSPTDNHISTTNNVTFNCSAGVVGGLTLANITLYTNETGSWEERNNTVLTGTSNTTTWIRNFVDNSGVLWSCLACDSNNSCGYALENRTIIIDTSPPTIDFVVPTEATSVMKHQNFIVINITSVDINLDKILIRLYNSTKSLINSSITSTSPNYINFTDLVDGIYYYNATANDTLSGINNTETRNITLDATYPQITYSSNSDTSNSSCDFTEKDWIWINVSVTETNVANVTFWTWTSSNSSFNKTTVTNQASIYTLNQTGLSKDVYFWNVTVCDIVGQCNTTSQRYYGDEVVNLSVDGFWTNKEVELGGDLNLSATSTYDYVFIDVDHPSYGTNYSSGKWSTTFELLIDWFRKSLFADSSTSQEFNFTAGFEVDENKTFNLSAHQYDEIVNVSFNISGTNSPYRVKFYGANSTDFDRVFYGNLTGSNIWQNRLVDKSTSPFGYPKTQNITFNNKGEKYLYFLLDDNAKLVNFLLNVTSSEYGFDFSEDYETNNYTDEIFSDAEIIGGFLMPKRSDPVSFIYDTFDDSSINTTLWGYDADDSFTVEGGASGYDWEKTTSESSGALRQYINIQRAGAWPPADMSVSVGVDMWNYLTQQDLITVDDIQFEYYFYYEGYETNYNYTMNYGECDPDHYIEFGDVEIFSALIKHCESESGGSCYEKGESSTPLVFYLTKQTNSSWKVKIEGTEHTWSTGNDEPSCGDYEIYTYWTNGTRVTTYDSCATEYTTVTNEFYVIPDYTYVAPIYSVISNYAKCMGPPDPYGCDTLISRSHLNFVNETKSKFSDSTYYSTSIFDSSGEISEANMSVIADQADISSISLWLSGDDGVNYQNVVNNVMTPITNPGEHMKYAIKFDMDSDGYYQYAPYVSLTQVETARSNLSNVYFDVGDDGTWEQVISGDFDSGDGTVQINLSNASLSNAFTGDPISGHTHYVPVVVNSSQAGQLNIEWINLTYDPNPVYLTVSYIQDFLTSFGDLITNIQMMFQASGNNSQVNITDLKFDYAGGNKTYTVTAHNNDSSVSVDRNITFYYSYWDYSWVPENVEWIFFNPTSPTTKNLKVYGQTDSTPILNITNYGYGGKNATLSVYLNDTLSCVNLTLSLDNNKSNGYVLNSSWQDLANMSFLDTEEIYLFADYSCSYSNWRLFNPYLSFRQSCVGCISSEVVI